MCVAYCEIVESALDAGISANREICLIPINVECGAVDATDTKSFIARLANWKRHGQIVFARRRSTRTGVQNHVGRELICEIISIHDVYPLRKLCSKWMTQCPHGLRREWIVVARNQEYRRMRGTTLSLQALPKNQARVLGHRTGPRRIVEHARRYAAPRRGCSRSRPCGLVRAFSEHPPGTTGNCVRGANRRCAVASARCLPARWGDWKNRLELWSTDLSLPQSDLWRWNRPPRHVGRVRNCAEKRGKSAARALKRRRGQHTKSTGVAGAQGLFLRNVGQVFLD
jgi:hypothetical protein